MPRGAAESESLRPSKKLQARLYPAVLEICSNNDFHQVNIREISKISGVSSGTIYKYFSSKEDLVFSILNHEIEKLADLVQLHISGMRDVKEIMRKVFWCTMNFYDDNPGVAITAFITVPMRNWMKEGHYMRSAEVQALDLIMDEARAQGQIDNLVSNRQVMDLYYMHCYRHIHQWYFYGMEHKLSETLDNFFELFWKALKP